MHVKHGKVNWRQVMKDFKCKAEELVFHPRDDRQPLKCFEQWNNMVYVSERLF